MRAARWPPCTGMRAAIPPMDPRPVRTMLDMGMPSDSMQGSMDMKGMDMSAPKPLAAHTPSAEC
jgi:hypothetical protein